MTNSQNTNITAGHFKYTFLPIQYIASKHPQLFQHLKARGYTTYSYLYILMESPTLDVCEILTFHPGGLFYLISYKDFSLQPVADEDIRNRCHLAAFLATQREHPEYQNGYSQCFATRSDGRIQPLF